MVKMVNSFMRLIIYQAFTIKKWVKHVNLLSSVFFLTSVKVHIRKCGCEKIMTCFFFNKIFKLPVEPGTDEGFEESTAKRRDLGWKIGNSPHSIFQWKEKKKNTNCSSLKKKKLFYFSWSFWCVRALGLGSSAVVSHTFVLPPLQVGWASAFRGHQPPLGNHQ